MSDASHRLYFAGFCVFLPDLVIISIFSWSFVILSASFSYVLKLLVRLHYKQQSNLLQFEQHPSTQVLIDVHCMNGPFPSPQRVQTSLLTVPKTSIMIALIKRGSYGSRSYSSWPLLIQNFLFPMAGRAILLRHFVCRKLRRSSLDVSISHYGRVS